MTTEKLDMDYSKYDFKDSTEMYVHLSKKGLSRILSGRLASLRMNHSGCLISDLEHTMPS